MSVADVVFALVSVAVFLVVAVHEIATRQCYGLSEANARLRESVWHLERDACRHDDAVPVESGGQVVAHLCLTCDAQLP